MSRSRVPRAEWPPVHQNPLPGFLGHDRISRKIHFERSLRNIKSSHLGEGSRVMGITSICLAVRLDVTIQKWTPASRSRRNQPSCCQLGRYDTPVNQDLRQCPRSGYLLSLKASTYRDDCVPHARHSTGLIVIITLANILWDPNTQL